MPWGYGITQGEKVVHGPARSSEFFELTLPKLVCSTEVKVQPMAEPRMARSTESVMGKVIVKGNIDPG